MGTNGFRPGKEGQGWAFRRGEGKSMGTKRALPPPKMTWIVIRGTLSKSFERESGKARLDRGLDWTGRAFLDPTETT